MNNQHVLAWDDKWAVRQEGRYELSSLHNSLEDAVEAAKRAAKRSHSLVVVHNKRGRTRAGSSHIH